ncbi:hypothetical protein ABZ234_06675 [Nocardiopsis sp. NPDC006198]|uniref:hypothetical protein n=1 Tax=Nocardiopsis sp. NPDC006198 TaxID=3154472 RepID=UPI0033B5B3EA
MIADRLHMTASGYPRGFLRTSDDPSASTTGSAGEATVRHANGNLEMAEHVQANACATPGPRSPESTDKHTVLHVMKTGYIQPGGTDSKLLQIKSEEIFHINMDISFILKKERLPTPHSEINNPETLYCKIFVAKADRNSVKNVVSSVFNVSFDRNITKTPDPLVEVLRNEDSAGNGSFSEDFLYWPVLVELELEDHSLLPLLTDQVSRLLSSLWKASLPAVAACDFEDQLPWNGGIRRDFSDMRED